MNFNTIPQKHITIIKHARRSLLFNDGLPWVKGNNHNMFDVTMGSFDGAEVCELVGLYIYRDDGLLLLNGTSACAEDSTRKKLHPIFNQLGLKITATNPLIS